MNDGGGERTNEAIITHFGINNRPRVQLSDDPDDYARHWPTVNLAMHQPRHL